MIRLLDYFAWRWRALRREQALLDDADYWDRQAAYCTAMAAEQRVKAQQAVEARINLRFRPPRMTQ